MAASNASEAMTDKPLKRCLFFYSNRACYPVATNYVQLSRDLFNAAFVSCWSELSESHQDDLLQSLKQALTSQDIPEITQTLLNLAEFMEHCEKVRSCGNV